MLSTVRWPLSSTSWHHHHGLDAVFIRTLHSLLVLHRDLESRILDALVRQALPNQERARD